MTILAKNIYLADDDEDDRDFFQSALTEVCVDCNLTTSINGDELLAQLRNPLTPLPDIIFLDINMPKKNGLESLEEIRAVPAFSSIPVVMFSTSDQQGYVNAAQNLGADLYLVKPYNFAILKKRILDIVSSEKLKQKGQDFVMY